jgi:hypothetical protein
MTKLRRMRWAWQVACVGEKWNAYRILVGKPERPRRRWVDNIKMDLRYIGWGGINWINLTEGKDQWRGL